MIKYFRQYALKFCRNIGITIYKCATYVIDRLFHFKLQDLIKFQPFTIRT